jgi:hypothetical protein
MQDTRKKSERTNGQVTSNGNIHVSCSLSLVPSKVEEQNPLKKTGELFPTKSHKSRRVYNIKTALNMRTILSSICVLALFCVVLCCTSCEKGSRECKCKRTGGEHTYYFKDFPANENAKTCKQLGTMLSGDGYSTTCW